MAHARFSPSKLSMILQCPASASYEGPEAPSSSYADEGTMLHECVAVCLQKYPNHWAEFKKLEVTKEQLRLVEECLLYAQEYLSKDPESYDVEQHVNVLDDYDCSGTPDLTIIAGPELHIVDWKFGGGIEVSATENAQLMAYGYGRMKKASQPVSTVVLHIVQPRLNNFSTYTISAKSLERWALFELKPGLAAACAPDPAFNPSESACRWCPRKISCTARLQTAIKNAELVFAEHAKMPDIPVEALQKLLPMAKQIEQVIKDLTAYGQMKLMHGEQVPGYKLVTGRANRVWVDEKAAATFMAEYLETEEMYDVKLITPAKAEDRLPRELKKVDKFTALISKPEGKPTMVPETDKRPAVSVNPEVIFAVFTDEELK